MKKALILGIIAPTLATGLAHGAITTFGSDNDGLGGFTNSAETGTESWTVPAGSVNYAFGVDLTDEAHTASLLKSFTLDKSAGNAYKIGGVLDLTAGYGDDNNRIGILLFNTTATQTADGGGGLWLRVNTDDGNSIQIVNGIAGTLVSNSVNHSYNPGDQWIGQTITFAADLTFKNDGVNDLFDIAFKLTDGNSNEYDVTASDLLVSDYAGTHFGFASKWRQRGSTTSERNAPAEFDYRSFELTLIPEPSSAMLTGLLGAVALLRRRR